MNNSLICVMDSLYDRKKAIDLCWVGWIIFCTKTGFRLTGTFWEKSTSASLFSAEMLGLCALRLLAWVVAEYYKVEGWSAMLCCDHKQALQLLSHHKLRIGPRARRYTLQPKNNKTDLQWHLLVCPCIWTYGQIPQMGAAHADTAAQLYMQHPGKKNPSQQPLSKDIRIGSLSFSPMKIRP